MPEYGDYKKEIKTLGDLRTFVNETLKDIEDDYTFDIDDDFMGIVIILTANCDVSYSEKSFYWTANVNSFTDVKKAVDDRIKARHKIKALDIIKPLCEVIETPVKKIRYLKINGVVVYTFKNEEEFYLLKEVLI